VNEDKLIVSVVVVLGVLAAAFVVHVVWAMVCGCPPA
jgi:hypothetical protein